MLSKIAELPDDSKDPYKRNMIDRYIDRPALEILRNLCFVEFWKRYQIVPKAEENVCQPGVLNDENIENYHSIVGQYPTILAINSKEKLKYRKVNLCCDKMFLTTIRNPKLMPITYFECFILLG